MRRQIGTLPAAVTGLVLGGIGACLGSAMFAMAFLLAANAVIGPTGPEGARPLDSLPQFLLSGFVIAAFGAVFAMGPGLLGGLALGIILRRFAVRGRLTRRNVLLSGLAVGAVMAVVLMVLFTGRQVQSGGLQALAGLGPGLLLAGLLLATTLVAVSVAFALARLWSREAPPVAVPPPVEAPASPSPADAPQGEAGTRAEAQSEPQSED
jgi:hypothetical protein